MAAPWVAQLQRVLAAKRAVQARARSLRARVVRLVVRLVGWMRPALLRSPDGKARRLGADAVSRTRPWQVRVHVYRLVGRRANGVIRSVGMGGIYHTGVEVGGVEYAYGHHEGECSGVWTQAPRVLPQQFSRRCAEHVHTLHMGEALLSPRELQRTLAGCRADFAGSAYSLLHNNCNHFSAVLCERLVGRAPPAWINRAAARGATLSRTVGRATSSIGRVTTSSAAQLGSALKAPIRRTKLRLSQLAGRLASRPARALPQRARGDAGARRAAEGSEFESDEEPAEEEGGGEALVVSASPR